MRISDWSSDVCSSDLDVGPCRAGAEHAERGGDHRDIADRIVARADPHRAPIGIALAVAPQHQRAGEVGDQREHADNPHRLGLRSEEHTSELQSLMRISYAVFCLKNKNQTTRKTKAYLPH